MDFKTKILVISGPTASGKSYLAEQLLKRHSSIVVLNADSMQVYKDLPILRGQPDIQKNSDKYKLYSFLDFHENCSVGLWQEAARKAIQECFEAQQLPVVVGGTGLYIKALLEGIADIPDIASDIKKQVQEQFLKLGREKFHAQLGSVDPISAEKIHPNDGYRMQRATEVYLQTGQSIDSFKSSGPFYEAVHISIIPERKILYQNCDSRFKKMLKANAEDEVKLLFEKIKNRPGKYNIENTLGYRSLISHLTGKSSLEEAIAEATQSTRNYAKRQCTWFRNQFPDKILMSYVSDVGKIESEFHKTINQNLKLT